MPEQFSSFPLKSRANLSPEEVAQLAHTSNVGGMWEKIMTLHDQDISARPLIVQKAGEPRLSMTGTAHFLHAFIGERMRSPAGVGAGVIGTLVDIDYRFGKVDAATLPEYTPQFKDLQDGNGPTAIVPSEIEDFAEALLGLKSGGVNHVTGPAKAMIGTAMPFGWHLGNRAFTTGGIEVIPHYAAISDVFTKHRITGMSADRLKVIFENDKPALHIARYTIGAYLKTIQHAGHRYGKPEPFGTPPTLLTPCPPAEKETDIDIPYHLSTRHIARRVAQAAEAGFTYPMSALYEEPYSSHAALKPEIARDLMRAIILYKSLPAEQAGVSDEEMSVLCYEAFKDHPVDNAVAAQIKTIEDYEKIPYQEIVAVGQTLGVEVDPENLMSTIKQRLKFEWGREEYIDTLVKKDGDLFASTSSVGDTLQPSAAYALAHYLPALKQAQNNMRARRHRI